MRVMKTVRRNMYLEKIVKKEGKTCMFANLDACMGVNFMLKMLKRVGKY